MALTQVPIELSSTPGIVDNSNATAITIDSSENVGIGTTSPSSYPVASELVVDTGVSGGITVVSDSTTGGYGGVYFADGTTGNEQYRGFIQYNHNNGGSVDGLLLGTSGSERLRIDAAGNVLVGKSISSFTTAGVELAQGGTAGKVQIQRSSAPLALVNLTDNGSILNFYKGTTVVGSIGSVAGVSTYIHGGTGYSGVTFGNDEILPCDNTGATRDAAIDLGDSSGRFKDLHLSGTMIGNLVKLRTIGGAMYVSPTNANTLNGNYDENTDEGDMWINYRGYQDTFNRFRDFRIGNGKGAAIVLVDGSASSVAITGSLSISSSLSKGSGSFKIDHPLPAKTETHHLVHSFVEAPQADNIYRGKVDLVGGSATVNIDTAAGMTEGTYVLLNTNTQCFTSNESGWTAVKGSVSGNTLTITAQDNTCTDTISWMVVGERHDQHMIDTDWTDDNGKVIVEPLKENN